MISDKDFSIGVKLNGSEVTWTRSDVLCSPFAHLHLGGVLGGLEIPVKEPERDRNRRQADGDPGSGVRHIAGKPVGGCQDAEMVSLAGHGRMVIHGRKFAVGFEPGLRLVGICVPVHVQSWDRCQVSAIRGRLCVANHVVAGKIEGPHQSCQHRRRMDAHDRISREWAKLYDITRRRTQHDRIGEAIDKGRKTGAGKHDIELWTVQYIHVVDAREMHEHLAVSPAENKPGIALVAGSPCGFDADVGLCQQRLDPVKVGKLLVGPVTRGLRNGKMSLKAVRRMPRGCIPRFGRILQIL
ncbi:hypothetical protein [Mesorhizobium sp. A623]